MLIRALFTLILMIQLLAFTAEAAGYRRLVNFEWDPIEGATSYDVELTPNRPVNPEEPDQTPREVKKFAFKSDTAAWNGKISPGKYLMRLRSRDYRGVPGDWSAPSEFDVGLDKVVIKTPTLDAQIRSPDEQEQKVKFTWQPVGGANRYHFELRSEDGKVFKTEELADTKTELKIPVAKKYFWKISASTKENIQSEGFTEGQFSVFGKTLPEPEIAKPETRFVREITWKGQELIDSYDVYLLKLNAQNKKWEKFQTFENFKGETLPFEATWPGGKYQVAVRSQAYMREKSKLTKQSFDVINGDRSPASEYTALVRTSIDRVSGWFGIASYLVTEISYSGSNPEHNSVVSYKARGGTGRLGAGWMSPLSSWGFLGVIDMSGFIFNGKTNSYASAEMNSIYRQYMGNRAELRVQMGAYYKELPETIGDPTSFATTGSQQSYDTKISAAGPHLGAEYWYSLTPKLGVQANMHLYYSAVKLSTPNGQALEPTLSSQIGFLGSYRFTQTLTGLVGYARREEKMAYKCQDTTFCTNSETNKSTISGHYLNFFAEWSF